MYKHGVPEIRNMFRKMWPMKKSLNFYIWHSMVGVFQKELSWSSASFFNLPWKIQSIRLIAIRTKREKPHLGNCILSHSGFQNELCELKTFMQWIMAWQITLLCLFSCPEELNRWPCHRLTHSVTQSLLLLPYKKQC